jgi:hypothetical protein
MAKLKVERLIGDKAMNNIISRHRAVQFGVQSTAEDIAAKAEALLDMHRQEGEAEIETSYGEVDGFVSLVDEAAESIEFGHLHNKSGEPVEGLYIITRASGIA